MSDVVTRPKTRVKTKTKTERPRLHKVILINDDYTPREFVVSVLKAEFRMTEDQAYKVMITAHRLGREQERVALGAAPVAFHGSIGRTCARLARFSAVISKMTAPMTRAPPTSARIDGTS